MDDIGAPVVTLAGSCFCPGSALGWVAPRWGPRDRPSKLTARGIPNGVSFGPRRSWRTWPFPSSGPQSRARPLYGPALNRLRRLCGDCRTSEIELIAGNPDAMHDHGKLASHGDGRALHAAALGDGDTPGPQARPLAGTRHQRRCSLVEEVPQHSVAALADLSRSVDLPRL